MADNLDLKFGAFGRASSNLAPGTRASGREEKCASKNVECTGSPNRDGGWVLRVIIAALLRSPRGSFGRVVKSACGDLVESEE